MANDAGVLTMGRLLADRTLAFRPGLLVLPESQAGVGRLVFGVAHGDCSGVASF